MWAVVFNILDVAKRKIISGACRITHVAASLLKLMTMLKRHWIREIDYWKLQKAVDLLL